MLKNSISQHVTSQNPSINKVSRHLPPFGRDFNVNTPHKFDPILGIMVGLYALCTIHRFIRLLSRTDTVTAFRLKIVTLAGKWLGLLCRDSVCAKYAYFMC